MLRACFLVAVLLGLFGVMPAFAVDGDPCPLTQWTPSSRGGLKPIWCVILVDDESAAASATPVIFSTKIGNVVGGRDRGDLGIPSAVSFQVGTDTDCSAGIITVRTSEVNGGTLANLSASPTLDLSGAGFVKINVDTHTYPIGPFISTTWASVAGCTGGFDILMIAYTKDS